MAGPVFVPDASVLLKWVLRSTDEGGTDQALALRAAWLADTCELLVPTLWVFEVGDILGQKHPRLAHEMLQAMIELGLHEEAPGTHVDAALGLMRDYHVTFYDAAYHALAMHHGATMVTADKAYVRKAGRAGHVMLLSEWERPR